MVEIQEIQHISNNDNLTIMVEKQFWVSRNTFKKTNKDWLEKMAKIPGKDEKYTWTLQQNMRIRERILQNNILPLHSYTEMVNKFSPQHQNAIKERFTDKEINTYISNLPKEQIAVFNTMSSPQLIWFLEEQIQWINQKKEKIQQETGLQVETSEQIANLTNLTEIQNRLFDFLEKNNLIEFKVNKLNRRFENDIIEDAFQKKLQECKGKKNEYDKLAQKYWGEKWADEHLRYMYMLDQTKKSDTYAKLSDESKSEFNKIIVDTYVMNQWLDVDMSAFWFESLSSDASTTLVDTYSENTSYAAVLNNIYSDKDNDIQKFFDKQENKLTELVPEIWKDKVYYTKLLTLYPELDTMKDGKKVSEYMKYVDEDMIVNKDITNEQKKIMETLVPIFKEQAKTYEDELLEKANTLTQKVAIEQCVATLEMFMDVDINEKENIIKKLNILDNKDAVSSDWVLHLDGTINGKKIKLSYNLATGKVTYKNFLGKKNATDQSPISLDAQDNETEVPLIELPTLGAFVEGAKNIDYSEIIQKSTTRDEYDKNFIEKIQQSVRFTNMWENTLQKDVLKKVIIKDMIAQDIVALTWKDISLNQTTDGLVTKEQYPQMYGLYNYLYRSLEYYSLKSIDQLQLFQKNIMTLLQYKNTIWTQSTETVMRYKEKNNEMFVLQILTNQSEIPQMSSFDNQWPEEKLWTFFKCFEKQAWGITIIDIEMMNDYFKAATGTNKQNNEVGKWKRNQYFDNLVNDFDTKISGDQASIDLDVQLKTV